MSTNCTPGSVIPHCRRAGLIQPRYHAVAVAGDLGAIGAVPRGPATPCRGARSGLQRIPAPGGIRPPGKAKTLLTAEPLHLDCKHEIVRRVHQERDQALAVRAEMQ
jgi:hypothetical protein